MKFKFNLKLKADPTIQAQIIDAHRSLVSLAPVSPPADPTPADWIEAIENFYEEQIASLLIEAQYVSDEQPEAKKQAIREKLRGTK